MKTNSFKIITKRIAATLLVSTVMFLSTASAQSPVTASFHENTAVVKYLGTVNDTYVFNVAYNNENGDKFVLSIVDEMGDTLFAGTYNEKKFDKRFKLLKEGNDKLSFVIRNLKENSVQTFEIKTTTHVIQDVVVRKVI
jgi:hypothetical protein